MTVCSDPQALLARRLDRCSQTTGADKYFLRFAVNYHVLLQDVWLELTIRCLQRVAAIVPKLWTFTAN